MVLMVNLFAETFKTNLNINFVSNRLFTYGLSVL